MLYFAYGSNMSLQRLRQRAPSARRVATAALGGHSLRFHKIGQDGSAKCDAFYTGAATEQVLGVVFHIDPSDKAALDRAEGLGHGYQQKTVQVLTHCRKNLEAFTYYALMIDAELKPFSWYRQHVLIGCEENQLPPAYTAAIAALEAIEDPDPARAVRELALYGQPSC